MDRKKNERTRGTLKVGEIYKEVQERRLDEEYVGKKENDGCGGEEKERQTDAEVDGQRECGLEGEGTVSLCGGKFSGTSTPHRSGKRCDGISAMLMEHTQVYSYMHVGSCTIRCACPGKWSMLLNPYVHA